MNEKMKSTKLDKEKTESWWKINKKTAFREKIKEMTNVVWT